MTRTLRKGLNRLLIKSRMSSSAIHPRGDGKGFGAEMMVPAVATLIPGNPAELVALNAVTPAAEVWVQRTMSDRVEQAGEHRLK